MSSSAEILLPASVDAEKAVLGAVLLDGSLFPKAAELTVEDFDRPRHRVIFGAMLGLVAEQRAIDHVTVRDALVSRGAWTDDMQAYLPELVDAPATSSNLPHYVGIVLDKAIRRRAVTVFQRSIAQVLDEAADVGSILTGCQTEVGRLLAGGRTTHVSSMDLVYGTIDRIQAAHKAREENGEAWVPGLRSGIPALDATIGGFERGHYHIIGGQTSMGKSAFALGRALEFALADEPGVYVSLEDQENTMGLRVLAGKSNTSAQDLRFGIMRDIGGWDRLTRASQAVAPLPIRWEFDCYTLAGILRALRKAKEEAGATWAVVDYLQLIDNPTKGKFNEQNRALQLGAVSQALRRAAKELDIAMIALSQLKRIEGRKDSRPQLSDLRDSGSLEQDASTVLLVSRPGKDAAPNSETAKDWPPEKTEVIVAKNKNGPRRDIHLRFVEETMTFVPWREQVTL